MRTTIAALVGSARLRAPRSLVRRHASLLDWLPAERRRADGSRKWNRFPDRVPLWVADSDCAAPQPVRDAVAGAAAHGIYGYADPSPDLVRATVAGVSRSWGAEVSDAWLRWHPGLIPALYHAARLAGTDGAVVVPTPVYPPFLNAARDSSRCFEHDVGQAGGALDVAALEATLDAAAAEAQGDVVLLWCNPHNPTGRVWRREEMAAVAGACAARDAVLVSDEVWSGLILDERAFTPAGALLDETPGLRLVSITSPSKTYNVAGLDLAVAVVPDDTLRRRYFRAGRDQAEITAAGYAAFEAVLGASDAAQPGGGCVLTPPGGACEAWRRELVDYLRANRDFAVAFIERECRGLVRVAAVPEASYLLWLDARDLGASPGLTLEKTGVYLTDGGAFAARGFVRLNFGCERATLEAGLECIKAACDANVQGGKT